MLLLLLLLLLPSLFSDACFVIKLKSQSLIFLINYSCLVVHSICHYTDTRAHAPDPLHAFNWVTHELYFTTSPYPVASPLAYYTFVNVNMICTFVLVLFHFITNRTEAQPYNRPLRSDYLYVGWLSAFVWQMNAFIRICIVSHTRFPTITTHQHPHPLLLFVCFTEFFSMRSS